VARNLLAVGELTPEDPAMNAPICPPVPSLPFPPAGPVCGMMIEICFFDAQDRPERVLRTDLAAYLAPASLVSAVCPPASRAPA